MYFLFTMLLGLIFHHTAVFCFELFSSVSVFIVGVLSFYSVLLFIWVPHKSVNIVVGARCNY